MRVQHETCSTICGTPVQAILDQKYSTGLAGGAREGQNIAQNGPRFWLWSPLEAPQWVTCLKGGAPGVQTVVTKRESESFCVH